MENDVIFCGHRADVVPRASVFNQNVGRGRRDQDVARDLSVIRLIRFPYQPRYQNWIRGRDDGYTPAFGRGSFVFRLLIKNQATRPRTTHVQNAVVGKGYLFLTNTPPTSPPHKSTIRTLNVAKCHPTP